MFVGHYSVAFAAKTERDKIPLWVLFVAVQFLRRKYRDCFRVNSDVKFVFLRGDYALIEQQLRHRRGHFMNAALLRSQFADLEKPKPAEGAITIELGRTPEELIEEIKSKLQLNGKD
jgi:gluconokinase